MWCDMSSFVHWFYACSINAKFTEYDKKNKETGAFTLEYMFVKVGWACGKLNKF